MTPPMFLLLLGLSLVLVAWASLGEASTSVVVALLCVVSALVFIPLKE